MTKLNRNTSKPLPWQHHCMLAPHEFYQNAGRKKLDYNNAWMMHTVLNKSWKQQNRKQKYPVTQITQLRRAHIRGTALEATGVFPWTTTRGHTNVG